MAGMNTPTTPTSLKIDFVSDVSCPWCAVGLQSLKAEVSAELHFQPFELNPQMGAEGQDVGEHLAEKYGSTPEQQAQIRNTIRARGAEVGFAFNPEGRGRVWNTFDAHRLLHWADKNGAPGQQTALKKALLAACHTRSEAMGHHDVLLACVREVGLDEARAAAILASDEFAAEVREREAFYQSQGIRSVPAVIINDRHLISGGQPAEVFAQALRQIAEAA
jgi:predicted DsbA family dithiol-disulfide isomerase